MKQWLFVALVVFAACKPKEVPFKPPEKEDAAVAPIDALEVDALAAQAKVTATKIVTGDHFSCALITDATLRCWGRNDQGQLGNGTTTDAATPVRPNLRGVKDIVLGKAHACALLDDESVTCWGQINFGEKGNVLAPAAAPGVAKAKRIFAVGGSSCATIGDGSLVCWGAINARGHIKRAGAGVATRFPTPANGLSRVVALTANGALKEDGTVWFWGDDGMPVRTAMTDVIEIASYGDEVCGLRRDGSVACAGPATRCAAAAPKVAPKPAPKKAAPKKTAKATPKSKAATKTKAGKGTAAAKKPAATTKPAEPPPDAPKLAVEVLRLPPAKHLAFDAGLCVVTRTGKLQCLATSDGCRADAPWPGLAGVDYVIGSCARTMDGDARCWGADGKSRVVTRVPGGTGAVAVAASSSHACALGGDQSIVCWGSNKFGALGRGNTDEKTSREASPVTF
jgi:hypothetical protein